MSKLSFRARALDGSKPMPIYMAEELPDLPEYSAINRAVPQMPSGMEKEEECEHHLQRAICAGLIIPTPEVSEADIDAYNKLYPADYKQPRQLIHMQPFTMEQDIPDYDMDSEDERWLVSQAKKLDLTPLKFEEMMDRLEKSSGQTVVTLNEAKALLKEDDDLIIAVFDYWLNKRLKTQHPLILSVKTEHRSGLANNPYLAFRRRTDKMQTRKHRKNDETSYEKMLKLRRDLTRAVTLLDMIKRREKSKREFLHLTIEVYEKRFQARDFSGSMLADVSALKIPRPAFTQIYQNFGDPIWPKIPKDDGTRKEKRQYKKRKHKCLTTAGRMTSMIGSGTDGYVSSDEEDLLAVQHSSEPEESEEESPFAFRRNKLCSYHMPITNGFGNWPWAGREENGLADRKYRYTLTSISRPTPVCVGFARRRLGRGGRVILDRTTTDMDDLWRHLDFNIYDNADTNLTSSNKNSDINNQNTCTDEGNLPVTLSMEDVKRNWLHFRPKTPPQMSSPPPPSPPSLTTPITVELQQISNGSPPSSPSSSSVFVTNPFTLEELYAYDPESELAESPELDDVNVDTSMQSSETEVYDSTTLNESFGCSKFNVQDDPPLTKSKMSFVVVNSCNYASDKKKNIKLTNNNSDEESARTTPTNDLDFSILSSTLTSPKLFNNSVRSAATVVNHVQLNGPITNIECVGRKGGNKMQQNAYYSNVGRIRLTQQQQQNTHLHNTLNNSHSANQLDIKPSSSSNNSSSCTSTSTTFAYDKELDERMTVSQCLDNNIPSMMSPTASVVPMANAASSSTSATQKQPLVRNSKSATQTTTTTNILPMEVT